MLFSTGDTNLFQLNQDAFDFNVQFEQLFFSIIPSILFIVTSSWRTLSQARKPNVVDAPTFRLIKLGTIVVYVGLELTLLILAAISLSHVTGMFIAASVLKLVAALLMITLSLVDHSKSLRPSVLLNSYLFLTLLLDAAQARTLFLLSGDKSGITYSRAFTAALAIKVGILLLESQRKSRWILPDEKEHSPEETSNIFSLGVFFWLNRLFLDGYRKVLTMKDLYPLDSALDSKLLHDKFSENFDYSKLKDDKFGLIKVAMKTLKAELLLPIFPRMALLAFTFCQPLFIERLLDELSKGPVNTNHGYGFIGASVLMYAGIAISTALYWYFHQRMVTMLRSVLITETFAKATIARIGVTDNSAALTLMSTDIERIQNGIRNLHETWACCIQAGVASWLLYRQLGIVFVTPIGLALLCFVCLTILMKFTGDSQRAWMSAVQKRVGLTSKAIGNMKNLKLSGLSGSVRDFIQQLRVDELAAGSRFRKIIIIAALLGYIPFMVSPPLTFAFAQKTLDAKRIFTSLSYLTLLTNPLTQLFQTIPGLAAAIACIGRIQAFLECETRDDYREVLADIRRNSGEMATIEKDVTPDQQLTYPISVKGGKFGWEANNFALKDVSIKVAKSSLTVVVGPIGSGKSTLCKGLLGEIPFHDGEVQLSTKVPHVGFCDQTAFLSNRSIKDNIVGYSPYDSDRYDAVIKATSLTYDIDTLAQGDDTNVGSDGITLSGGQKQRVSLARALYLQSDLLILDDIFSGLDADTEEQVFRQVFGPTGLLKKRKTTVVLCTHSIRHLPAADYIIALGNGTVEEQGSFDELISRSGYVQRLRSWGSGRDSPSLGDKMSNTEDQNTNEQLPKKAMKTPPIVSETEQLRQVGDITVYKTYFKSMGMFAFITALTSASLRGFFSNFATIWLTYWTADVNRAVPNHSWGYYAGIYGLLQVSALLSLLALALALFIVAVKRAGASLHQDALKTLIGAPLRFFTSTDTGVVTNLFSQDLNLIDTELSNALLNTLYTVFGTLGEAAVILTSSPYMAISYPFLIVLLYILQKFYLRTSRQLRLLDLEAKSPLYTHFIDTVKGITTLRAFGFISDEVEKNRQLIDTSQRPAYLLLMIQQWLTLVLDLVVMIIAAVLTTLAVRLHTNSGFTGASLVSLMGFGDSLSGIVIFYTKLETSIGAISRLKTFNDTVKPESQEGEDNVPSESWPERGLIELRGVSATYDEEDQTDGPQNLALQDLDLTFNAGEKVAICGRTGSGKSSVIALLLKLLDPLSDNPGTAMIDNTTLNSIDRATLRQRVLAVPQEAVFLPDGSTFQANLDPSNVSTPQECQTVLQTIGMWDFVQERGGLTAGMSADTLSAGQRQLLSLGRVVLRRSIRGRNADNNASSGGILLLDEVSSSVDQETERVIQAIIKAEFTNYTVIAVSHRLEMIMDFDRVVVMDRGQVVEVGNPAVLAEGERSRFGELVKAGGAK